MRSAHPPVISLLQFRHERITSKEAPEMSDVRAEVERAYQTAAEVVQRHDLQHLNPYQLAGHISRARQAHLADLEQPAEELAMDWRERGRAMALRGEPCETPHGMHPRSRPSREFRAGYDEAKAAAPAE